MGKTPESVTDFLAQKRIVVAGVSRHSGQAANAIYCKLRDAGYAVTPINPNAETVEGDQCYPDLVSVPDPVDGVVIATAPAATMTVVRECQEKGVRRVWMHRSFGQGSVSDEAADYCRKHGIDVIVGGCPMMFCQPVDPAHKVMCWVLGMMRRLPT
jgi:predicted CoA-binding protein